MVKNDNFYPGCIKTEPLEQDHDEIALALESRWEEGEYNYFDLKPLLSAEDKPTYSDVEVKMEKQDSQNQDSGEPDDRPSGSAESTENGKEGQSGKKTRKELPPVDPEMMSTETVGGRKTYCCQKCPYKTRYTSDARNHLFTHSGTKPHQCPICPYRCNVAGNLKAHMVIHSADKPFCCHLCTYKSSRKYSLAVHIRSQHRGPKAYGCAHCDHRSSTKRDLIWHLNAKHSVGAISGGKDSNEQYAGSTENSRAEQCGKKKRKRLLPMNPEMMSTEILDGWKTYCCQTCPYKTEHMCSARNHLSTHTGQRPHQCPVCPFRCSRASHLKAHVVTHSANKPFRCHLCSFRSIRKHNLIVHIRGQHRGPKAYGCAHCSHRSTTRKDLIRHLNAKHGVGVISGGKFASVDLYYRDKKENPTADC